MPTQFLRFKKSPPRRSPCRWIQRVCGPWIFPSSRRIFPVFSRIPAGSQPFPWNRRWATRSAIGARLSGNNAIKARRPNHGCLAFLLFCAPVCPALVCLFAAVRSNRAGRSASRRPMPAGSSAFWWPRRRGYGAHPYFSAAPGAPAAPAPG